MKLPRIRIGGDTIAAVLALAVLVAIVLARESGAPATDTYASTDYQSGGYAAWYALMEREGVPLERFEQRTLELDRGTDTLITAAPVVAVVERRAVENAALEGWVRAGGRLIRVGAVTLPRPPAFASTTHDSAVRETGTVGPVTGALAGPVRSLARVGPARLPHAHPTRGERSEILLADARGIIAIRETRGRGEVVRVSDPHIFANDAIARAGNARFAYLLARSRRAGGIVAFDEAIHGALVDRTWWGVLRVPVRIALGGVFLAAFLAIIGGALRLGPAIDARVPREPSSGEFIAAVAGLYERTHARSHAIEALTGEAPTARPTDRDLVAAAARVHAERLENR